ncbi:uncharacterized protein LOC107647047 [Arachis ipaensis]|uniref:uncharacterized protein LOC107647047 n=1 Tax=Arachis ipaensis TaxID=130454 RepID=UPI000A2B9261|nr:uncharacterized protein LOC107647047 [Arachis ipaensis]
MDVLMAMIDLKVVLRVRRMKELSEEKLHWCEHKMSKVRIVAGKLQTDLDVNKGDTPLFRALFFFAFRHQQSIPCRRLSPICHCRLSFAISQTTVLSLLLSHSAQHTLTLSLPVLHRRTQIRGVHQSAQHSDTSVRHASVGRCGAQFRRSSGSTVQQRANASVSYSAEPTSFCHLSLQGHKYKMSETNDVSDEDGEDDDVDAMEDEDIGGFQF